MRFWQRLSGRGARWAGKDVTGLIPVRKVDSSSDADPDGNEVLLVPRFRSGLSARWLQPRLRPERAHVRVRLDAQGSFVWRCMDGTTPVGDIISRFEAAFPDQAEIPGRVWMFLTAMEQHGLVRFDGEAKPVENESSVSP